MTRGRLPAKASFHCVSKSLIPTGVFCRYGRLTLKLEFFNMNSMRRILFCLLLLLPFVALATPPKLPPEKDLKALTLDSLLAFNRAVKTKSFVAFHQQISALWREQITPEQLSDAFKPFMDQGLDISEISGVEPVFGEPPAINGDGVLVLKGSYPARPMKISFELKYVYEHPAWKLIGVNVQKRPSVENTGKMPSDDELKALVLDSLLAFNKAIQEKSFAGFHEQIAALWRDKITPEKLAELFKPFLDAKADISKISKAQPVFDEPPEINSDGLLVLKGYYLIQPGKVSFQLKYIYEGTAWKLVGINVNI